jgi:glutathione S-transferase
MSLKLFLHPFSSYSQKAATAFYENGIAFEPMIVGEDAAIAAEFAALSPAGKFPLLTDGATLVFEASSIIEYLDVFHPGPTRFVPDDPALALEVRMLDRFFDNYVHRPMQEIVGQAIRPDRTPDAFAIDAARGLMNKALGWLEAHMADRQWAAGDGFTLADCAAAPALFYADWAAGIAETFPHVRAYRARLLARPSYARAVDEARPYRHLFPLGAPDRD